MNPEQAASRLANPTEGAMTPAQEKELEELIEEVKLDASDQGQDQAIYAMPGGGHCCGPADRPPLFATKSGERPLATVTVDGTVTRVWWSE